MKTEIYKTLSDDFPVGKFIRVGENRNVSTYVGRDSEGRYSFDFRGRFKLARTKSSEVICVAHIQSQDDMILRFSLENSSLLEYFCAFCADLVDSVLAINDDETAYSALRMRYFSWKQLFKPNHGNLTEIEIMGLIGELLFLRDYLIPKKGDADALESWMGPEKTHKDFSFNNEWFEIKAVSAGKDTVLISSIEQLDSNDSGFLVIYSLEKMSPAYDGLKLNTLVNEMIPMFRLPQSKELFLAKLALYGFDFSPENDNFVYDVKSVSKYKVEGPAFPRITRGLLPQAISNAKYDIVITLLEPFKVIGD